jgi:hypothetical protein
MPSAVLRSGAVVDIFEKRGVSLLSVARRLVGLEKEKERCFVRRDSFKVEKDDVYLVLTTHSCRAKIPSCHGNYHDALARFGRTPFNFRNPVGYPIRNNLDPSTKTST